ncbi:helix-turn-helix domain-containing protein [Sphingomonas glacialis]|uniref:DNA-binding protein n=1 Tax=Sphingomonas glacialis TaxID=658225 RepID=A0A502G492_9SPHN|nr:helix-turn-helix domain-containing protein [Sphingomonas glacialis]TPG56372.1 DNA-binding protein [Sphingomonas glacialis]
MADLSPIALTIPEVVTAARMPRSAIYIALKNGNLAAKKQGRRTLILREELNRFLAALPDYQAAA